MCIHQLFEQQVAHTPEAIALVFADQQLTYRELNERVNQLAHYLRTLGVQPETLVGLCLERSLEMIIGLLGILKAGGAYVPLDPAYPRERLAFMLTDAQISLLLTQQSLLTTLTTLLPPTVVCLDTDWPIISQQNTDNPDNVVTTAHLAYLIYTSGSTGTPKGVLIEHHGLSNLARAQIRSFGVQPTDRILQFSSISFDAAISEMLMALLIGAVLYLGHREALLPGLPLLHFLRDRAITTVTLPPSILAIVPLADLPALHTLIVAGEACSLELATLWQRPARRFFNAYGPTEITVCATIFEYTQANFQHSVPIGRPISQTPLYVLDAHLQRVPIGVPGELHIGGIGLARGYLNRPELTAEKFIANPFYRPTAQGVQGSPSSPRLYKTGDLVRYRPDGQLEFLGRLDHQIKIRGFRVELGEIENLLHQHSTVQEAVVIAREDNPGDKRLVAYLVGKSTAAPPNSISTMELRQFLKEQLPDYMVPSALVWLDALPLTPNGKVDRAALPPPAQLLATEHSIQPPQTATEQQLATIWQTVLHRDQLDRQDNFFEVGGNSLLLMQVYAKLIELFHREIPVTALLQYPTISTLAHYLDQALPAQLDFQANYDRAQKQIEARKQFKSKK